MKSKIKTHRYVLSLVFPRLAPILCIFTSDSVGSLPCLRTCVVIGQSDNFGFDFTMIN